MLTTLRKNVDYQRTPSKSCQKILRSEVLRGIANNAPALFQPLNPRSLCLAHRKMPPLLSYLDINSHMSIRHIGLDFREGLGLSCICAVQSWLSRQFYNLGPRALDVLRASKGLGTRLASYIDLSLCAELNRSGSLWIINVLDVFQVPGAVDVLPLSAKRLDLNKSSASLWVPSGLLLSVALCPGGVLPMTVCRSMPWRGTHYDRLYGDAPPERGPFFYSSIRKGEGKY